MNEDPVISSIRAANFYRRWAADEFDPAIYNEFLDSVVGLDFHMMVQQVRRNKAYSKKEFIKLDPYTYVRDRNHPKFCENCGHKYYPIQGNTAEQRWCSKKCARTQPGNKCKHGHEFTTENTRVRSNGGRECLACEKARHAHRKAA